MRLPCSKLALSLCLALGSASAFAGSVSVDTDTATAGIQANGTIALNGTQDVNLVFNRAMPAEVVTSVSGNPGLSFDTAVFDVASNNGSCTVTDGTGTVAFITLDFAGLADGAVICTLTFTNTGGADLDVEPLTLSGVQPVGTTTADGQLTLQGAPPVQFTVTATGNAGGTVAPPTQDVNENTTADVTATPNANFRVASISGCGAGTPDTALPSTTAVTYTTAPVTADCAVTATFEAIPPTPVVATITQTPANGSTTAMATGFIGTTATSLIDFTATGGANGGQATIACTPTAPLSINNGNQTVTDNAVQDITVSLARTGAAQGPLAVTCNITDSAGASVRTFNYTLAAGSAAPVVDPAVVPASSLWSQLGLAGLLAVLGLIAVGFRRQQ